jgi:hypothetical protein
MSIVLLAFLIVTVVPALEYVEWKNETKGLVLETGRVTKIDQRRCRSSASTRKQTCNYAREHVLLADRSEKVIAFLEVPSIFAAAAFVTLLAGSWFVRDRKPHRGDG